jgi:hypothetical protein
MPNRWPISSGNWSNAAIWSGSIIPTASDDVFANNRIVNIDTNITVRSITNASSASAVTLGGFFIPNNGVTITSNVIGVFNTSSVNEFVIRCTGSNSSTIIGNISTGGGNFHTAISMVQGSSLTVTGSVQCSNLTSGGGTTCRSIVSTSSGSLRISGSVLSGGNGSGGATIFISGNTTVDIRGNVSSIGATLVGPAILTQGNANINIVGNVIGTSADTIVMSTGASTLIITGSIESTGNVITINDANSSTTNYFISGSIINNGTQASFAPLYKSTSGTIIMIGPIYAGLTSPGIQAGVNVTDIFLTGPFYNRNNINAVYVPKFQLLSGSTPTWTFDTETFGEQRILYTQNWPGNFPSTSNVRQGTVFGDTSQFTGTVAIPSTGSVLKGVPVDNVTGSASFTTQNVWNTPTSSLTASNSLGTRLRNTATVASDGILIALTGSL